MLYTPKLKRATFYQFFPLTVNPATRHQAYMTENCIPMSQGTGFGERRGSSIYLHSANVTVTVQSDLFSRLQMRTLRPTPQTTTTHTSLNQNNQILLTTNMDADFTGFKATVEGISVPVQGELITQTNTTVIPRCTLTQADIATGVSAGHPSQHVIESITYATDATEQFTTPSQINRLESTYRTMLFTCEEPPSLTASSPIEWLPLLSTTTPYDPSFNVYSAYPFTAPFLDDINSELIQTQEQYGKMGATYTNIHRYKFIVENQHQIQWKSDNSSVVPIRGGLYFLLISDVNVGMSESLEPDTYQHPERLNSRWLVPIVTGKQIGRAHV